jgi:hypothetical protein
VMDTPVLVDGLGAANLYRLGLAHRWDILFKLARRESNARVSSNLTFSRKELKHSRKKSLLY